MNSYIRRLERENLELRERLASAKERLANIEEVSLQFSLYRIEETNQEETNQEEIIKGHLAAKVGGWLDQQIQDQKIGKITKREEDIRDTWIITFQIVTNS